MENTRNQNYRQDNLNFQQEPETSDFEIIAAGINGHNFQNEEFIDDSPNLHPIYNEEEEEINPEDDEEEEEDNENEDDENDLENKYGFHPERDIFDQDLLNPFTTDAGL